VTLGTLVIGTGFRNPALLAKMADTVDEISGGRLFLGLGAGYHKPEYDAFGYPDDHRYSRFAEAIEIVYGLLRHGEVDFAGKYHQARACVLRPRGPRPQGPPIMIGTIGPRMLRLTARYADAWNAYYDDTGNDVANVRGLREAVDSACQETGRAPETLERTVAVLVADASADPWWDRLPTGQIETALKPLTGDPETIAEGLAAYRREGLSHVQICLEPTTVESVEAFASVLTRLDRH
jgi:alkanesulfonate monooxygenase SsuD/methylene tetrahydromethanopterin reductase-like flavin-dependent oxidoreductase (luciferase family)